MVIDTDNGEYTHLFFAKDDMLERIYNQLRSNEVAVVGSEESVKNLAQRNLEAIRAEREKLERKRRK